MPSWQERESDTRARSRADNESTARARGSQAAGGGMSSFRCECGDEACTCAIRLTAVEYESVRAYATHFAIAGNHENPESEQLVEEHERFAVVETVYGEAAKLARRSYPRQWRRLTRSTDPLETSCQVPEGRAEPWTQEGPAFARARRCFRAGALYGEFPADSSQARPPTAACPGRRHRVAERALARAPPALTHTYARRPIEPAVPLTGSAASTARRRLEG